jgi:hypothetical protein
LTFCLPLFWATVGHAQSDQEIVEVGKKYIDLNLNSLSKYEQRAKSRQERLLNSLKRKEQKFSEKLRKQDSVAWQQYCSRKLSFDSISRLAQVDSNIKINAWANLPNRTIDSLQGVIDFLNQKVPGMDSIGYLNKLSGYKDKLNYRNYIDGLISKRSTELQSFDKSGLLGTSGISKQVYYAKAQLNTYKALAENPDKMEQEAYEFLQGQVGFDENISQAMSGRTTMSGSASPGLTSANLEQMGYQTRRQVNVSLKQKLGDNLDVAQNQIGKDIGQWQSKATGALSEVKSLKSDLSSIKNIHEPGFRVNPMRMLPFWKRFERSFDFQITRSVGVEIPAMLQTGLNISYRHNPKLSTGIGIMGSIGLGQNWSSLQLSFESLGLRVFTVGEVVWGIGIYAGAEQLFGNARPDRMDNSVIPANWVDRDLSSTRALAGLVKNHNIGSKHQGGIQILYDFLWKESNLNTPLLIRFVYK